MHFHELPLHENLLRATDELGYEEATEIQQACIPAILKGKDVIGKSQTGTGKTAAFGLPLLQLCHIQQGKKLPQMLVLLPTRELAMQVGEDLRKYLKYTEGLRTVIVYGGEPIVNQINELKKGADIIVGTPGRILDHIERSTIRLHQCDKLVLDEADEMLDMGFREDIDLIIEELPSERQSVMFSATMPKEILELKERYLKDPVFLQAKTQHETAQTISQYAYFCKQAQKKEVLMQLITLKRPELSMVFCNTRKMVDELTGDLVAKGYPAACIHGDMKQEQRTSVLERFKNHKIHVLVCTDVAARGLDIANLDIVFNYDFPQENEYYVHRIGRTGRAGKEGVSITLLNHRQHFLLNQVQKMTKAEIIVKPLPTQAEIAQIRTEQLYGDLLDLMQGSPTATMHTILDRLIQAGYSERDVACMLMQQYFDDTLIESIDPNAEDIREFELPEQTTIYLNLGTRQGIKPAHLVAAITSVSGHPNDSLGKIHIRDLMSSVEVPVEGIENWIDDFRKETINGHSFKLSFDPMADIDVKYKKKPKETKTDQPVKQEKKKTSFVKKEKKDKKEPKSKFPSKPRRGQGRNNKTQPKRRRK